MNFKYCVIEVRVCHAVIFKNTVYTRLSYTRYDKRKYVDDGSRFTSYIYTVNVALVELRQKQSRNSIAAEMFRNNSSR